MVRGGFTFTRHYGLGVMASSRARARHLRVFAIDRLKLDKLGGRLSASTSSI
jgi:hypothetical protein